MLKKILLAFFAFWIVGLSVFPGLTYAQAQTGSWYNQSFQEWYTKVNDSPSDEIFGERYTAAQVQWVIYGLFYFLINGSTNGNGAALSCLMTKEVSKCSKEIENIIPNKPIFSDTGNTSLVAVMFEDRPLSLVTYIKGSISDLKLIPTANAQQITGFGFNALNPAQSLWKIFRNMAYAVFVFVIIAFAFMIMFRVKISPQAVITVQSALPKIAITLILITFSYAIAGLMVDLMYVVIGILSLFFSTAIGGGISPVTLFAFLTKGAIGGIPIGIFGMLILYLMMFMATMIAVLFFGNGIVGFVAENLFTLGASTAAFSILTLLTGIILLIVFLIAAIKIMWMLFKTYANIILLTVFAPLQIATGAVMNTGGFGGWLRSLISNLAVFPVVGTLFLIAFLFLMQTLKFVFGNYLPANLITALNAIPIIGTITVGTQGWPPLLGVNDRMIGLVLLVVSLVVVTMIPKTVEIIQGIISGKGFAYGTAIGEAVGPFTPAAQVGAQAARYGAVSAVGEKIKASRWGQQITTDPKKNEALNAILSILSGAKK